MRWKSAYIVIILGFISFGSLAQPYISVLGSFEVDQKKGCVPFTVTVTIRSPFVCPPCDADWEGKGDANFQTFTPSFTYTTAGKYYLRVLIQDDLDSIQIEALPNTPPTFDLYTCSNNEVQVLITDKTYDHYVIDYPDGAQTIVNKGTVQRDDHPFASPGPKNITVRGYNDNALDNCASQTQTITALAVLQPPVIGLLQVLNVESLRLDYITQPNVLYRLEIGTNNSSTFQNYKAVYNITSETLSGLRTEDNYYCFRLRVSDPCNPSNPPVYSNVVCSANFDLSVQNNSNNLTWATSLAGVSNLRLNRTEQGGSLGTTVTGTSYSDTDITCGVEYCYQLLTNYPNGSQSISLEKCGVAISTDAPATIQNITAVVQDPGVTLEWQAVTGSTPDEYSVFRSLNGNVQGLVSTTDALQLTDGVYTTAKPSCYVISYVDVCGNTSLPSAEACPIKLAGNIQGNNAITLNWSAYTGWQNGVSDYIVEKYSTAGNLLQTFPAGTNLTLLDESQDDLLHQSYLYIVKANATEPGLPQAVSNAIIVTKNANIFYPTAFTPNGDNLNDLFSVFGQYVEAFEMNIFNRWGELVYTASALEHGWDGTFRGNPMPEGSYAFVADITDTAGRSFKKSGTVLLLRKK